MKSYEKESLLKSSILFFSVQLIFLSIVIYQHYHKILHEYDMHVGNKIMQCHISLECNEFKTTHVQNRENKKVHTFYKDTAVYMLFKSKDDFIKVSIDKDKYLKKQQEIQLHIFFEYGLYLLVLILESSLFALYAIRPLKYALKLNEEFVKDILHDFNTPLSALKINLKILKKKFGEDDALQRADEAIETILSLQENLHYYLAQSKLQKETISLNEIIEKRVLYFRSLFPKLKITFDIEKTSLYTNEDILVRIIDNLISNACKYNKQNGEVFIVFKNKILTIQDSGIGIKNSQDIFKRHYVENRSGIGIGLHIVEKLCEELKIPIEVKSTLHVGTAFILDLSSLSK